ncbi:hypothetical protein F6V30_08005 [Oryzomonas sagensis]|uniref:Uncharacterized protein n=1 Tax=Oryzomonas sagensis TaxID=2603857 RepID=A0ABQ6TNH7_9BACT|nr:hypothetical protein [Oryzomonas sagensis]KAB0670098.1 hypothetical protein F6V30_08005 [Oryzomonas sagensis]
MELTVSLDDALVASLTRRGAPPQGYTVEEALRDNNKLVDLALNEIRGFFTKGEICLIADVCNGYWYTVDNPKVQLCLEVSDAIELEALDEKWGVEKETFLGKLTSLCHFHAHVVITMVRRCWDMSANNNLIDLLEEHFLVKSS